MFGHIGYLPPTLVNKPHVIVQNTVLFNVIQYFGRRGKEGIEDMKVGMLERNTNELFTAWVRVGVLVFDKLMLKF